MVPQPGQPCERRPPICWWMIAQAAFMEKLRDLPMQLPAPVRCRQRGVALEAGGQKNAGRRPEPSTARFVGWPCVEFDFTRKVFEPGMYGTHRACASGLAICSPETDAADGASAFELLLHQATAVIWPATLSIRVGWARRARIPAPNRAAASSARARMHLQLVPRIEM